MGHDESRAGIAAVGDRECPADRGLGAPFLLRLAVVAVPRQWSADHDDEPSLGIDDDLVGIIGYSLSDGSPNVPWALAGLVCGLLTVLMISRFQKK
ncbi:hypothetical protein FHX80_1357 [Streptomyces brevispora]|uniref:Uncharacterized protein n=1 Tax=Streptomyces brevispora TaxID=887462 RepID=A0A561TU49_9ACTN|nr:hypothetical protein FHX80_1357 [Streptomyces brevispora]